VFQEILAHLAAGIQLAADQVFAGFASQPGGGGGNQSFHLILVGLDEEPHHGFFVVRLVGNVGENQDALWVSGNRAGQGAE
jgi:hypothetical protein